MTPYHEDKETDMPMKMNLGDAQHNIGNIANLVSQNKFNKLLFGGEYIMVISIDNKTTNIQLDAVNEQMQDQAMVSQDETFPQRSASNEMANLKFSTFPITKNDLFPKTTAGQQTEIEADRKKVHPGFYNILGLSKRKPDENQ
jgi:hypothetical protein